MSVSITSDWTAEQERKLLATSLKKILKSQANEKEINALYSQ